MQVAYKADPVTPVDIARRLGMADKTVKTWVYRGQMPERRWTVGRSPCWDWNLDIVPWARKKGYLPDDGHDASSS